MPAALPRLFTGFKLALSYALIGVIAGEFILSGTGLGYAISFAYQSFDNRAMYGLMLFVLLVAVTANGILYVWEGRLARRRSDGMSDVSLESALSSAHVAPAYPRIRCRRAGAADAGALAGDRQLDEGRRRFSAAADIALSLRSPSHLDVLGSRGRDTGSVSPGLRALGADWPWRSA